MKFEYLVRELEKAEKYIFLEYFIVQEGKMCGVAGFSHFFSLPCR